MATTLDDVKRLYDDPNSDEEVRKRLEAVKEQIAERGGRAGSTDLIDDKNQLESLQKWIDGGRKKNVSGGRGFEDFFRRSREAAEKRARQPVPEQPGGQPSPPRMPGGPRPDRSSGALAGAPTALRDLTDKGMAGEEGPTGDEGPEGDVGPEEDYGMETGEATDTGVKMPQQTTGALGNLATASKAFSPTQMQARRDMGLGAPGAPGAAGPMGVTGDPGGGGAAGPPGMPPMMMKETYDTIRTPFLPPTTPQVGTPDELGAMMGPDPDLFSTGAGEGHVLDRLPPSHLGPPPPMSGMPMPPMTLPPNVQGQQEEGMPGGMGMDRASDMFQKAAGPAPPAGMGMDRASDMFQKAAGPAPPAGMPPTTPPVIGAGPRDFGPGYNQAEFDLPYGTWPSSVTGEQGTQMFLDPMQPTGGMPPTTPPSQVGGTIQQGTTRRDLLTGQETEIPGPTKPLMVSPSTREEFMQGGPPAGMPPMTPPVGASGPMGAPEYGAEAPLGLGPPSHGDYGGAAIGMPGGGTATFGGSMDFPQYSPIGAPGPMGPLGAASPPSAAPGMVGAPALNTLAVNGGAKPGGVPRLSRPNSAFRPVNRLG